MARANRHYLPGYVWHITHRCHKREFLLRFARDRHRYLQWLYQCRKRFGLSILSFNVTCNHVHLLVVSGDGDRDAIPRSMQLLAGRTGQEFNRRKNRSGAYWEDRYHATAVETGAHLARCMVYIETNMVRAGVVGHPALWPFCSYNQIQNPRKKNVLIDYARLQVLLGMNSYDEVRASYKKWMEEHLAAGQDCRRGEWTESIAVGSKAFAGQVKDLLGIRAAGREVADGTQGYQLRERIHSYSTISGAKNNDMEAENGYFWDLKPR